MTRLKFSDDERAAVIERIETLKNFKLKPVGSKRKFFKGSDGLHYCIVGGRGDWHAIPEEVMVEEKTTATVHLIIARWLKNRIEIYGGLPKQLFDSRDSLSKTKQGDFQFELKMPVDGILSIRQVPRAKFSKIDEFKPPNISIFKNLSEEQRRELLRKADLK
jgi:hypothetical protein